LLSSKKKKKKKKKLRRSSQNVEETSLNSSSTTSLNGLGSEDAEVEEVQNVTDHKELSPGVNVT
jgi:hypothetical protein